ncbi:MAG: MBL fold metallo-hydrolase, partial [Candidatus Nitrosopolaris sp.]
MALTIRNTAPVNYTQDMENDLLVTINGTLPDFSIMGDEEKSERAAEVKKMEIAANTSCSVFTKNTSGYGKNEVFHLLIDIGEGVIKSIEQADNFASKSIPNAVLITHSHDDHIKELPILINKVREPDKLNIYCTDECRAQIMSKFPELGGTHSSASFNTIKPGETFQVGLFSVTPILASHGENSQAGSVIYVVVTKGKKIIFGWDFLTLPNVDESLLWNPDLLILGTQSYNPHPEQT